MKWLLCVFFAFVAEINAVISLPKILRLSLPVCPLGLTDCNLARGRPFSDGTAYDFILIDCPPNLGLLTLNALTAADLVIVPVQTEYLAMRSIKELMNIIDKVKERTNPELDMKLLCTMFDRRTIHGRDVIEELREIFGHQVFDTVITRTIKFADASVAAETILTYAKNSEAAEQYRNLADAVEHTGVAV